MPRDLPETAPDPRPLGRARADPRVEDLRGGIRREAGAVQQGPNESGDDEAATPTDLGPAPGLRLSPADMHGASMAASDFVAKHALAGDIRGDEVVVGTHAGRSSLVLRALAAVAVAAAILFAVFDLYLAERVKDLRSNAAQLQRQLASMEHRLGRLELEREQQVTPRLDEKGNAVTSETNSAPVPPPAFVEPAKGLSQTEIDIVREYIKTPPGMAAKGPTLKVGMSLANQPLIPLPPQLIEKLPKLVGARFRVDRDGAVVIVPAGSDRIGFIVPPR